MPTTQMMPNTSKVVAQKLVRPPRVEQVRQAIRNPKPVLNKSNPLRGAPAAIENPPAGTSLASARRPAARSLVAGFSVEKALVGFALLVAVVLVVLFALDLACAWPFGRDTPVAEAVFCGCGVVLGYLSWDAYRDLH
ncbi:MAG: hypothetical protein ABSG53_27205 [Thermoguttaceae bacterium]|jgi:hypothetical protein